MTLVAHSSGFARSHFLEAIDSPHDDVQIWLARLGSILPNELEDLSAVLDSMERSRASRFHFERDREHYVCARGILRSLLGAALDIPASNIAFKYGAHGKPEVASPDQDGRALRFNISHAASLALFALTWNRELGIDLEASERFSQHGVDLTNLAARVLSQRELAIWCELPNESARRHALLRAWARKEAYVKATGAGLHDRLQAIEVALDAAAPEPLLSMRCWNIYDLRAPAGFCGALAVEDR